VTLVIKRGSHFCGLCDTFVTLFHSISDTLRDTFCTTTLLYDKAGLTDDKAVAVVTRNCAPALSKNQQQYVPRAPFLHMTFFLAAF
jgi:hypothetical protein